MTKTQNPWNFIIPVLKVSVTKVQGFLDLREVNFETSCRITCITSKWWKYEVTKTQNPWNFNIPVLKVSVTKFQGISDLRKSILKPLVTLLALLQNDEN